MLPCLGPCTFLYLSKMLTVLTQCLDRDRKRCIMTGTPNPEVCHVVPFVANNTDHRVRYLKCITQALRTLNSDLGILTSAPGWTDEAWNMLSLAPSLHGWWGRGYFAFRCLGVMLVAGAAVNTVTSQSTVDLQLHWLSRSCNDRSESAQPPSMRSWEDAVLEEDQLAWIQEWQDRPSYGVFLEDDSEADGVLAVPHPVTSRLLQTGNVFSVTLPSLKDAQKCRSCSICSGPV